MNHSYTKTILTGFLVLISSCLQSHAGRILVSATPPSANPPSEVLHRQVEGDGSGSIISLSKLFKDVEAYPSNGSSAVLMTFTLPQGASYRIQSMTVQIDSVNAVALGDNAAIEVALYRNDNPADRDFDAEEVISEPERFDLSRLIAAPGSFITFVFDRTHTLEGGVQHGFALQWTLDSVAPDSLLDDRLLFRLARTNRFDPVPGEGFSRITPANMADRQFPPSFTGFSTDDPVMVLIGEPIEAAPSWAGIALDPEGWADTGGWLGMVNVKGNWVYAVSLERWLFFPDPGEDAAGGWAYFFAP